MSIDPGTVVDRYLVSEQIGSGAMGEVYLATDEGLGRKVAVKILLDAHRQNPELRARFVREARSVAAIQHPNVVQVFTTGEWDQRPFIAMEYLAGEDLGSIVKNVGPLDSLAAASALVDAARGLEAAARAGLIHRDVKPSNLVRLDAGGVKVTDFGLAKPVEKGDDPALTALGVVVGTPDYIAPEQARGEEIDSRVDVYALGCTAFYLLVGRPPFRKGIEAEDKYLKVVARHLRDPAPDPRRSVPGVDDELAELVLAMMAKSPDDRPDYPAVLDQLEKIVARLGGTVVPAGKTKTRPRSGFESTTAPMTSPSRAFPKPPAAQSLGGSMGSLGASAVSSRQTRRVGRLLWVTTSLSAAVFLAGLGLFLFGRATPASKPVVTPVVDAGPPPRPVDAAVAVAPAPPTPPPGMILVSSPDGKPLFFVDRAPVTHADYKALIRSHRFAAKAAKQPVSGISFDYARSFAKLKDRRLLRADEWPLALAADGFAPAGMKLWEWVDDGNAVAPDRPVRRAPSGEARRKPSGDATITFRLAQDL